MYRRSTRYSRSSGSWAESTKKYLTRIDGIGPTTAARLVDQFGVDVTDFLRENPDTERPSYISEKRWTGLLDFLTGNQVFAIVAEQLSWCNLTNYMIGKIAKHYGMRAGKIIEEDPYCVAYEVEGIGFRTVDTRIAPYLGIGKHDPRRARGLVLYLMRVENEENGHMYSTLDTLKETNWNGGYDDGDITDEEMKKAIRYLSTTRGKKQAKIVQDGERLYLTDNFNYEKYSARQLGRFLDRDDIEVTDDIDSDIKDYNESLGSYSLDEDQEAAIRQIMSHRFNILTGGPGTGKTTIIGSIVTIFEKHGLSVCLAAPTGRAAKRMTESTGKKAETIHRMLGFDGSKFEYNYRNTLSYNVVIVDESSMIDMKLFDALLSAIDPSDTCLILVGDVDQLPSVGAGRVLPDLINSGCFSVVRLTNIHRQAGDSHICDNAQKINHGVFPEKTDDFRMITYHGSSDRLREMVENIVLGCSDPDVQILAATNKTVDDINRMVQAMKNPPSAGKKEIVVCKAKKEKDDDGQEYQTGTPEKWIYREGDKIMQLRNVYDAELYLEEDEKTEKNKQREDDFEEDDLQNKKSTTAVYNGDIGVIQKIDESTDTIVVRFDKCRDVAYCRRSLQNDTRLAYAMTIHKSQGSEFDSAVIILPSHPRKGFVTRKLVYTAVTRAKKQIFLLGDASAIAGAISDTTEKERRSRLMERVQDEAGSEYREKRPRTKLVPIKPEKEDMYEEDEQEDEDGFMWIPDGVDGDEDENPASGSIAEERSTENTVPSRKIIVFPGKDPDPNGWLFSGNKEKDEEQDTEKLLQMLHMVR